MKKTAISLIVIVCMMLTFASCTSEEKKPVYYENVSSSLEMNLSYYDADKVLTDWWEVIALSGAGVDLSAKGFTIPELDLESIESPSAYAKSILSLLSIGENPKTYYDKSDLVTELIALQKEDGSFGDYPNEHIYSIIALETVGNTTYNRDGAMGHLVSISLENGGYNYFGDDPDPDLTGIALTALALFKDNPKIEEVAQKAITWLGEAMSDEGTYPSAWEEGVEPSESVAAVISGLVAYGVDMETAPFLSLVDSLLTYQTANGGFGHADDSADDFYASYQALIALAELKAGKSIYSFFMSVITK